jgi:hypothetical protein
MSTQELTTIPPAPGTVSKTGIVLSNMDEIWRFAETVINSGMAPKGINNPSAATITIQMGMELGLPPMASLQNIAAINGRPSIWGDAMLGVVRSTGELEEFTEWYELDGTRLARTPLEFPDALMAVCRVKRRGYEPVEASFSVADAKRAKLWGKQGPWSEYTARMLKFRARSFALRDEFGDALRGLYSAEEQRDLPPEPMRDVTPRDTANVKVITGGTAAPEADKKAPRGKAAPKATEEPAVDAAAAADMPSRKKMYEAIKDACGLAQISPQTAEVKFREAKLLTKPKLSETTDEELFAIYEARFQVLPPKAAKSDVEVSVIRAFYENHQVSHSPEGAERKWTCWKLRYSVSGDETIREAVTFSSTIGDILDKLEGGEGLILTLKSGTKGDTIETLEIVTEGGAA